MAKAEFSKRTLIIVFSIAAVSLISSLAISIFKVDLETFDSPYSNIYSKSAVGHKAFRTLLKKIDIPVSVSNYNTDSKASSGGLLMLIEPQQHFIGPAKESESGKKTTLEQILRSSPKSLVVLPKWRVVDTYEDKNWVDSVERYDNSVFERLFQRLNAEDLSAFTITERPDSWETPFEYDPNIQNMQLIDGDYITPIISCDEGILLGYIETTFYGTVYILSDPDLISNYNITRGDNGILAVSIIDYLRDEDEGVIIDEMMHGFIYRKSIWRMLFDFPNVMLLISALIAAGGALWKGLIRTRKPEEQEIKEEWGKAYLVTGSAHLITTPKHRLYVLDRYFRNTLYYVAKKYSIKCDINNVSQMVDRVAKHTHSKKLHPLLRQINELDIKEKISSEQVQQIARKIYRWKEDVTNGTS